MNSSAAEEIRIPLLPRMSGSLPVQAQTSEASRFFYDLNALRGCRFIRDFKQHREKEHFCRDIWYLLQPRERKSDDAISRAFEYIGRHYTEAVSIKEMAKDTGYSTVHFINTFKERYGVTPLSQITRLRMMRADELLRNTAMPVREVAYDVGYGDEFYFSRIFRHHRGVSPRQFRTKKT